MVNTLIICILTVFIPSFALRMTSSPVSINKSTGKEANVKWRAVPMAHLRKHPNFVSLPHPNDVIVAGSYQSLGLYRQDSWQWDALHSGRLTTSRLSGSLGFYEVNAAILIGVPRSLQSHSKALSTWQEMKSKAPTDWTFLSETKLTVSAEDSLDSPWACAATENASSSTKFICTYQPIGAETSVGMRRFTNPSAARLAWGHVQEATAILAAVNYFAKRSPGSTVRESGLFAWEALRETVEHRQYLDQQAVLRDILGVLPSPPASASSGSAPKKPNSSTNTISSSGSKLGGRCIYDVLNEWIKNKKLPVLGASPDGIIRHADGTVEVLEVKCTSPFATYNVTKCASKETESADIIEGESERGTRAHGNAKRARAESIANADEGENGESKGNGDEKHDESTVAPTMTIMHGFGAHKPTNRAPFGVWHVPQLQLEMLCVGAHCRSAVILLYSISGVKLYRIERSDDYIFEMLSVSSKFYNTYISGVPSNRMKPPPPNFFDPRTNKEYAGFLKRTVAIAESAVLIEELREDDVQRSPFNTNFFL